MGRFTKIPTSTFDELQVEAGVLLKNFDPETGDFEDSDIISATTGGNTLNITPTFSDYGEDVDNCPNNTKELKRIDDVAVTLTTSALNISEDNIKFQLGASDIDASGKITVRKNLRDSDFSDIWLVGDMANGGFVAIKIINALSTGGFSLKTTKKGKGQVSLTITGHFSIEDVDAVPVEIYLGEAEEDYITLSKTSLNLKEGDVAVLGVTYSDPALIEDTIINLTTDVSPVKGAFSSDKKSVIVTANDVVGECDLLVYNGGVQGICHCVVTAAD